MKWNCNACFNCAGLKSLFFFSVNFGDFSVMIFKLRLFLFVANINITPIRTDLDKLIIDRCVQTMKTHTKVISFFFFWIPFATSKKIQIK